MINVMVFLIKNECLILCREIHEWLYPLLFFCMILVLFPLSFSTDTEFLTTIAPGCVWIATLFSSILSIQHFFVSDLQDGFLQESMLSSIPLTLQIGAKFLAHWLMHIIPLLLISFVMAPLFHLSVVSWAILALSLILGTPILMLIGIFSAALTIGLQQQGSMMAILIFPLIVPVMIFAINIVLQFNAHLSISGPLYFLSGLCMLAITLFPPLISSMLRLTA